MSVRTGPLRHGRVRTPTVLQMDMLECGAASLGILLGHFGRFVPAAELRRACGVSRDGSKASNVVRAARSYGLVANGYNAELAGLSAFAYPYIVFWNFNHFLVVEGFERGRVCLNDPATGPRTVSVDEFDDAFTGVVLKAIPGPEFVRGGRPTSVIAGVWSRLKTSGPAIALCMLTSLLLVLPAIAAPALARAFVDDVLVRRTEEWARPIILGVLCAALLKGILTAVELRLLRRLKARLSVAMSTRFVWHLLQLPADFYAQRYSGEVAGRVGLADRAADAMSGPLASSLIDAMMLVVYVVVMWQFDVVLTAVAVGFAVVDFLILGWFARRRRDASAGLAQAYGKLAGVCVAGLQSIRTIKAAALESELFERLTGHHAKAMATHQRMAVSNLTVNLLPRFVSGVMTGLILMAGAYRVMNGTLTIGMLVAFQSLVVSFFAPVNGLLGFAAVLQTLSGDITRLDDVLQHPPLAAGGSRTARRRRLRGHVELRNVAFGYNPIAPPFIENFSLVIAPGHRVALVGASGSGKSTIARLIAGLYAPTAGEILFDGLPRDAHSPDAMAGSFSMVDQDVMVFAGSVRDNLTLWDSTIGDDALRQACCDASIHEDLIGLPDGYDSELTEGASNLSGGQRQRLELARALAIDPTVVVLDEATSAIDPETERHIDHALRRRGCSCVIVAHRLSTIRDADEILVLEGGRIVQRGRHSEMIAEDGPYARLVSSVGAPSEDDALA